MEQKPSNCNKCGICLSVCPVFKVQKEEQAAPRARIQLIKAFKAGKLETSALFKEIMAKCLMCGSCHAACPAGVNHYEQFMDMRAKLIEDQGDRLEIKGLVYLLAREQRLRLAMGAAQLGQKILPDSFQQKYRLGNIPIKNYPTLNEKPFRRAIPENIAPVTEEKGAVLYFTGCATNYIFDATGFATVKLLTTMGFRVIIPGEQTCCSIPMLYHGGIEAARTNIDTNIDCFGKWLQGTAVDAVIVDCPTCGSALKTEFPAFMQKRGRDDRPALRLAGKVTDLMTFIHNHLDLLPAPFRQIAGKKPELVTYHTPCHLRNSFAPADQVLREIPGLPFAGAADANDCCGGGGTFFYEYPDISAQMSQAKVANARKTGASIWLTDCPVCRINLGGQLDENDRLAMMHPAQYLARFLL